jgi:hypothetical protein
LLLLLAISICVKQVGFRSKSLKRIAKREKQ